ncbi:iron(III) transport system substrate-binding protein [Desulfuromusa kysingii]|uniref:Iron(III) transport system substrate-binding protein n=1 Tax=Desulfuromusa kysingii TaxID=37625 RepID=A0A1H4AQD0_9BACT|nr:extracellular solute-binding protein [Desulfuromusa kysingii]SEA38106.1 iron(III) transport system substrate-binding protein [Desulfuromusa kysingii]
MKKMLVLLLSLVLICGSFGAALAAEKINFYANITAIEPIIDDFNSSHTPGAIYTRISTSKYLATVLTEFSAGKLRADVLQSPLPIMQILKEKGVLAPYKSAAAAGYPTWAQEDDSIIQFGIEYVAPIYNKDLVKPEDVPTRYEDLTDPKWYNKMVMPDPASHATTISWLVGMKEAKIFGDDAGWMKFLKGLAANKPMFVKSFGPTPAPIESGEKVLGISMPKYIISKAPAPLAWAKVDTLLGTPRGIAVAANASDPKAAQEFVDYWLSKNAMQLLASQVGEYVLAPGVFPPIDGISTVKVLPIRSLSDDEIRSWGKEFRKIFYEK